MTILCKLSRFICHATTVSQFNSLPASSAFLPITNHHLGIKWRSDVASYSQWTKIYQFPLIRLVSAFNRLKLYQAVVTTIGTPLALALEQANYISGGSSLVFGALGITGLLTLSIASYTMKNVVGIIYKKDDEIKIAYVDFFGKRQNIVVHLDDLIPSWEQSNPPRYDFYQRILFHSNKKRKLILLQRFGLILDPQTFEEIFGS